MAGVAIIGDQPWCMNKSEWFLGREHEYCRISCVGVVIRGEKDDLIALPKLFNSMNSAVLTTYINL